jgi:hypothetical protein
MALQRAGLPENFFSDEQLRHMSQNGLHLAEGRDLIPLTIAFSGAVATMGVVESRIPNETDRELLVSSRTALVALIRDMFARFDYEISIGVSSFEQEPPEEGAN